MVSFCATDLFMCVLFLCLPTASRQQDEGAPQSLASPCPASGLVPREHAVAMFIASLRQTQTLALSDFATSDAVVLVRNVKAKADSKSDIKGAAQCHDETKSLPALDLSCNVQRPGTEHGWRGKSKICRPWPGDPAGIARQALHLMRKTGPPPKFR